jgi:hypothetical protein
VQIWRGLLLRITITTTHGGQRFAKHAEKLGRVPTELLIAKPRTAFDDMALRIFLQEVADATGVGLKVVWASADSDA